MPLRHQPVSHPKTHLNLHRGHGRSTACGGTGSVATALGGAPDTYQVRSIGLYLGLPFGVRLLLCNCVRTLCVRLLRQL